MQARALLSFVLMSLAGGACTQQVPDSAVESDHLKETAQLQEVRLQLKQALAKKELQYVQDNVLYFQGVLRSVSASLAGDSKKEVESMLHDLERIAQAIANSARPGSLQGAEADLQRLIDRFDKLERHLSSTQ